MIQELTKSKNDYKEYYVYEKLKKRDKWFGKMFYYFLGFSTESNSSGDGSSNIQVPLFPLGQIPWFLVISS